MKSSQVFNSPIEIGMRMVYLLLELYPKDFDVFYLTYLDYALVYSADLGGPDSLHTPVSQRGGAFLSNSDSVDQALKSMCKLGFVEMKLSEQGITYLAGDNARAVTNSMGTLYTELLKEKCTWVGEFISDKSYKDIQGIFKESGMQWGYDPIVDKGHEL